MLSQKEQHKTSESQPNNKGGNGDIHEDNMNADESDRDSRQSTDSGNEGREGHSGGSNRRSSRIAGQLRVRYSDNGRRNFKGDSKGRSTYNPRG